MDGILEIELFYNLVSIICVGIHIVTDGSLGRATVAATIVSNHAISLAQEEHHLSVPVVGRQRPTVMKKDRLSRAPVFIENLGAIFGGNRRHGIVLLLSCLGIVPCIAQRLLPRFRGSTIKSLMFERY